MKFPAPVIPFVMAHAALWGLFWWVDDNYTRLVWKVGGLATNLPQKVQGGVLFADWIVAHWYVYALACVVLTGIYWAIASPPEGREPKKSLMALCWLPLLGGYGLLLWLIFMQRVPIDILNKRIGGGGPTVEEVEQVSPPPPG